MGSLIQLAIYAALAAAAVAAVMGFLHHQQSIGAEKQLAKDRPIIQACVADRATAIGDRDKALAANKQLADDLTAQNAAAQAYYDQSERMKRASHAALEAALATGKSLAADEAAARVKAMQAVQKGESCEQTLADIYADLRDMAVRKLRDRPGPAPVSPSGNAAAGNQNRDRTVPK